MRVGIDICRLTDPWTGIGNYITNLLGGLAQVDRENQYLLYPYFWDCFPLSFDGFADFVPPQDNFRLHAPRRSWLWVKLVWLKSPYPRERFLARVDVTHSPNLAAPRLRRSKLVVTVHDLSFLREPAWHKADNVAFSSRGVEGAVQRADAIIVPSEFTAHEMSEFYPAARDRVHVVPEAVLPVYQEPCPAAELARVKKAHALERPYFLFVGTLEPRKNLVRLISAFHGLIEQGLEDVELVLAGGLGWKADEIRQAADDPKGQGRVRRLGYVPGPDLPGLYQGALAVVYPSLYEGFGLPVLEALASGAPCLTSRAASLPEVAGEAALLVDSDDSDALAQGMLRLARDADLRARLALAGPKQAARFSRAAMGAGTLEVYRHLAGR